MTAAVVDVEFDVVPVSARKSQQPGRELVVEWTTELGVKHRCQ
jgi:hypothetical protein